MENGISTTLTITPIMAYLGAWFSTCGLFWVLFSRGETILSPALKGRVRNVLKDDSDVTRRVQTWPQQFGELFDAVFGMEHISWKCFFRSSVTSIVAVLTLYTIWRLLLLEGLIDEVSQNVSFFDMAVWAFFLNVPIDYFSLLETRYVIKWMSMVRSLGVWLGFLCLDLLLTIGLFVGIYWVLVYPTISMGIPEFFRWFFEMNTSISMIEKGGQSIITIFFYSTFFTSFWVWLYALSCFIVRLASLADWSWKALTWSVDVENKPILSLGTISIVLITLGYFVVAPFVLLR